MRKLFPVLAIIAGMAAAFLILALAPRATAPETPALSAGAGEKVIVISIQNEGIQTEFKRAFEEWHKEKFGTPCEVEWRDYGGTSQAVRRIDSEYMASPNGIGIDVLWGGGAEPYIQLSDQSRLEPISLPAEIAQKIPAEIGGVPLRGRNHEWYGSALSGFGIISNKRRLADLKIPEPKTWTDIAAPGFLGEVSAADPRASGTAQAILEVILQAYGWEKGYGILAQIAGNVKNFSRSAGEVPKLVSMGQIAAGMAIDFYGWTQVALDGSEKTGFVLPEGLTPLTPDGMAVLKGAPNMQGAKRFMEFVLSPEGQRLWVLPVGHPGGPVKYELLRIPVLIDVYKQYASVTNVKFDPSRAEPKFQYDSAKAAERRDVLKDLYGAVFIDLSPEVAAAWKGIIRRGMTGNEVAAFCRPPMSEADMSELARKSWSRPDTRNRMISEWTNSARALYTALALDPHDRTEADKKLIGGGYEQAEREAQPRSGGLLAPVAIIAVLVIIGLLAVTTFMTNRKIS